MALFVEVSFYAIICAFARQVGKGKFVARNVAIVRLFAGDAVEELLAALDTEAGSARTDATFGRHTAASVRTKSPTSLKIALTQMRRGPTLDFNACIRTEFRIVSRVMRGHDIYEGIRAALIDKDQAPRWRPSLLAAVSDGVVKEYLAPVEHELELP